MSWQQLDDRLYAGPLVRVRLHDPSVARRRKTATAEQRIVSFVECWALIDTGATHSIVDTDQVAQRLELRVHDTHRLTLAGRARAQAPVHEVELEVPDHPFPTRRVRVASMALPGPFWMLIGMDLLDGTRLSLECGPSGRWLRWEPLTPR
jgi:predicted aspartyl protease